MSNPSNFHFPSTSFHFDHPASVTCFCFVLVTPTAKSTFHSDHSTSFPKHRTHLQRLSPPPPRAPLHPQPHHRRQVPAFPFSPPRYTFFHATFFSLSPNANMWYFLCFQRSWESFADARTNGRNPTF